MPVLVVDDQAPFRHAARAVVDATPGFEVVAEADSGEQAIELVASHEPRLVLMDINLPGRSGIEVTQEITRSRPGLVVVLLSTYPVDDLPADLQAAGAAAYVGKEDLGPDVVREVWEGRAST